MKWNVWTHLRQLKQPLEYPSCGLFLNVRGDDFCRAMDKEKKFLKGYRLVGGSFDKACWLMVNVDNGTAADYENFIGTCDSNSESSFR